METTETNDKNARLTLTEASRVVPGRPHPSAVWRWARKGVKARTGERIRLKHSRVGGRVFTTLAWIDEFGDRLAEADSAYFDARTNEPPPAGGDAADGAGTPPVGRRAMPDRREEVERELEKEGL